MKLLLKPVFKSLFQQILELNGTSFAVCTRNSWMVSKTIWRWKSRLPELSNGYFPNKQWSMTLTVKNLINGDREAISSSFTYCYIQIWTEYSFIFRHKSSICCAIFLKVWVLSIYKASSIYVWMVSLHILYGLI